MSDIILGVLHNAIAIWTIAMGVWWGIHLERKYRRTP